MDGDRFFIPEVKVAYLGANKARVKTAGHRCISSPLDNRPPIREQSHLIGLTPKLQNEIIMPKRSMRTQLVPHLYQIQRSMPLMNLHRIPPAQGDMRTPFTGQMNKFTQSTSAASR